MLCIRLAIWMFIRSKELQLNRKHGRAELYPGGGVLRGKKDRDDRLKS